MKSIEVYNPFTFQTAILPDNTPDHSILAKRVSAAATIGLLGSIVFSSQPISVSPYHGFYAALLSVLFEAVKYYRTIQELGEVAEVCTKEFTSSEFPKASASRLIASNPTLIQKLIDLKVDLKKKDDHGESLLKKACMAIKPNINAIELLLRSAAWSPNEKYYCLSCALLFYSWMDAEENNALLKFLAESQLIKAEELTAEQQIDLWTGIPDQEAAKVLKKLGLDINVKDKKGWTALMHLAYGHSSSALSLTAHAHTLIQCGADPTISAQLADKTVSASSLAKNKELKTYLQRVSSQESAAAAAA